ncbi:hypothetical protein OAO56_04110 [Amylibacter sp.]|nr:hypothetical protein [Amylibacter sp.]
MTRIQFLTFCIASFLFLNSCSKILEPVSLFDGKKDVAVDDGQEEFEINIKSLTFNTAKTANKAPFSRRMIFTGSGSRANVYDEANFLKSNLPNSLSSPQYVLGVGDQISYKQIIEFNPVTAEWPSESMVTEYLLGPGDELTFLQSNDNDQDISIKFNDQGQIIPSKNNDTLITTKGIIGSNGNILLFGLGNIQAANRTLDDVRTEVRNILIRNGLAPNFQLEISNFLSKEVYLAINAETEEINDINDRIFLTNLPMTLKEILLTAGISEFTEDFGLIKLTRKNQEFRFTAGQLFNLKAPEITLQGDDKIEINISNKKSITNLSTVGPRGYILIDNIGRISAINRTLDDIHADIKSILIRKGYKPDFQLELTKFASSKAYFIQKNVGSIVITLTSSAITLRELILKKKKIEIPKTGLSIITLKRNGQVFRMTEDKILDPKTQDIWIIDKDQIEIENLTYKPGQVFALSGAGSARVVSIDPSKRETLAEILFSENGALNNLLAKRSEVYLLRGKNPSVAYHLDAQNVSRVLVAAKTELRPNDIVYVADRPIISFSRTLSEILPLRILLRDIQDNNIP